MYVLIIFYQNISFKTTESKYLFIWIYSGQLIFSTTFRTSCFENMKTYPPIKFKWMVVL